jgi:hypothetical protein
LKSAYEKLPDKEHYRKGNFNEDSDYEWSKSALAVVRVKERLKRVPPGL